MRKGVAVPYVIALILGVAVIALIGIWFVMSGGKFSGQSSTTLCESKFVQYCVTNPSGTYESFKTGTECASISSSFKSCGQLLGTCIKSGESCPTTPSQCCSGACSGTPSRCN